jgi:hypothetical protein
MSTLITPCLRRTPLISCNSERKYKSHAEHSGGCLSVSILHTQGSFPYPILSTSSRLGVVVQGHADGTTVMSVVLSDDQLALQLPQSRIMI